MERPKLKPRPTVPLKMNYKKNYCLIDGTTNKSTHTHFNLDIFLSNISNICLEIKENIF